MDFELPRDVKMLQGLVRKFVEQELIPIEMQVNQQEEIDDEVLRPLQEKIKQLGLWHLEVPKEYGGLGLGMLARCVVREEVAKTKALPFRHNDLFGPTVGPILYQGNADQIERFLKPVLDGKMKVAFAQSEPDTGADPASMRTRAVRDGDHYILNGAKRWITGAGKADFTQVVCLTDPEKRARGGISILMVDMKAPGVTLVRNWPTMMGDAPWEIAFDNVRVPVENRLGEEGQGFALAQNWLTHGRVIGHGAYPLGVAQRCYEMMIDYARQRVTFGQPLSERQAIQFMISDSAMEIECLRMMVYRTAWMYDNHQDTRDLSYMCKIMGVETAGRVVDRALQVHGAVGLSKDLPLEYWYRQIRSLRITEGATEVMRWRMARNITRARG